MPFKAATWNVLANAYLKPEWYPGVALDLLDPARRVQAVARHAAALGADILCLQEVEREVFAAVRAGLAPPGGEGRYEKKGAGRPDGCATFFRQAAFAPRGTQRLDYRDRAAEQAKDSGHVALLLALEHEGRLLGVANTHVRWDKPRTPRGEQVGRRQVLELLEACARFTPRCDGWLVCGDFNRTPDDEVLALMRQARFVAAHEGRPHVRSAVTNGRAKLIDYIFHAPSLKSRPQDPPAIHDDTLLPSPEQPSDHLALAAEMGWA
jgi:endonuclease/exonuclease/phosphatase family metal-dependent hydrolase